MLNTLKVCMAVLFQERSYLRFSGFKNVLILKRELHSDLHCKSVTNFMFLNILIMEFIIMYVEGRVHYWDMVSGHWIISLRT